MSNCNKVCEKANYHFASNNMSTKMLQAQALKLKTNSKIIYKNTRLHSIYKTILSLNYYENKSLLIRYKYKLYKRYFDDIQNVTQSVRNAMNIMLFTIKSQLSTEEYNIVFDIVVVIPEIKVESFINSNYIFYVVTRILSNVSYFIIKNITDTFVFQPGYSYTFDLSDPTNVGTKFSLSANIDGISYSRLVYSGTPGTPGAILTVNIESLINIYSLYVFNDEERVKNPESVNYLSIKKDAYKNWGYTRSFIYVNVENKKDIISYSYLYKNLKRESFLAVHEINGPKYLMVDPADKTVQYYKNQYKYTVSYGTYYLYVPRMYPAALLNSGYEDCISFVGLPETKTTLYVKGLQLAPGNLQDMSYNFYWGEVALTIYKPFTSANKPFNSPFSFYCAYYGFMDGFSFINFSETGDSYGSKYPIYKTINLTVTNNGVSYPTTINGITCQSNLNCIKDGINTYLSFNNDLQYDKYRKYGLYNGIYTIFNIPKQYPITLLNYEKTALVTLKGLKDGSTTSGLGPDNNIYTFYWGTLRITVSGNFGNMSLYSKHQGYTGRSDLFVYDAIYDNSGSYLDPLSIPTITPVASNTQYTPANIYTDSYSIIELKRADTTIKTYSVFNNNIVNPIDLYNVINLTNSSINKPTTYTYVDTVKYSLKTGMYILNCPNFFIALLNNGKTDSIKYEGDLSTTMVGLDGNIYSFYKNNIVVSVYSNFGYISVQVLGTGFKGNNILCYGI